MPAVVHVHVQVRAGVRAEFRGQRLRGQRECKLASARLQVDLLVHRRALETLHGPQGHGPHGHFHRAPAAAMEVAILLFLQLAVVVVVAVQPAIGRRVVPRIGCEHHDAAAQRLAALVAQRQRKLRHRLLVLARARDDRRALATDHLLHPQAGVACAGGRVLVADVQNPRAIVRPARVAPIELAERERQGRAARGSREPDLVPLPAVVAREHEPPAVGCELRPRSPGGFLHQHALALVGIGDRHGPQIAGAPRHLRVADVVHARSVRAPARIDRVIVRRVVVAVDRGASRCDQRLHVGESLRVEVRDEQVESTGVLGRHEREAPAVGRKARLQVDGAELRERLLAPGGELEEPQLHRVLVIAHEHDPAPVGGDVGLKVVTRAVGQLASLVAPDLLQPQRSGHAVHDLPAVRHERRRRGTRGRLRHVHFPPVIAVRNVDLLEHRLARSVSGRAQRRGDQQGGECRYRTLQSEKGDIHIFGHCHQQSASRTAENVNVPFFMSQCPVPHASASFSAASSITIASSTCSRPIMSGGMKRTVLWPHESNSRPL